MIAKYGKGLDRSGRNIGSGAYRLTGQVGDQQYTFTANPSYYLGAPSVKQVKVSAVGDSTAAVARYQAGEFDAVVGLSAAAILQVKANPTLRSQFHSTPIERTVWLAMNNKKPPFNNKLVRQAFNAAIDKSAIIKIALAGVGTVRERVAAAGNPRQRQRAARGIDVRRRAAQQPSCEGGLPGRQGLPVGRAALRDQLRRVRAGVRVDPSATPEEPRDQGRAQGAADQCVQHRGRQQKTRPLLWGYTFGFDYPDAQELTQYLGIGSAPYNYEGYTNKRYDALIAKANADSNQKRRAQLYAQAENVRLADAPTVPLYFVNQNWLVKPNVTGFGYSPLYMHPWRQVTIR